VKAYIAGKITGKENYKDAFIAKEKELMSYGYIVMNPAILPYPGFEHHEYMHICKAMIDVCDSVYFMNDWHDSHGAKMELSYAIEQGKTIWFEEWTVKLLDKIMNGDVDASKRPIGLYRGFNQESR